MPDTACGTYGSQQRRLGVVRLDVRLDVQGRYGVVEVLRPGGADDGAETRGPAVPGRV